MINLREERMKKGYSQYTLASLSGVGRSLIANIECGLVKPSVTTAKKLAKVLEVDWALFFSD